MTLRTDCIDAISQEFFVAIAAEHDDTSLFDKDDWLRIGGSALDALLDILTSNVRKWQYEMFAIPHEPGNALLSAIGVLRPDAESAGSSSPEVSDG